MIDLIAATRNAFSGAILARRPTHYRNYTTVGILLLASFAGSLEERHVTFCSPRCRAP